MLIAISRVDGGVSIMRVLDGDPTDEIEKWKETSPGQYVSHREINESDVPKDRSFRNAWREDMSCDLAKAREIARARVREARAPLLAKLDGEYMRADEASDAQAKRRVSQAKQRLRDAPADARLINAASPEDLKAAMAAIVSEIEGT